MCAMQIPPITTCSPRKRRRARSGSPSDRPQEEKREAEEEGRSHPAHPPPRFWDELSKIPLTRSALRELDRRNDEQLASELIPEAEVEPYDEDCYQKADEFISRCPQRIINRIKRLALHGGPDLEDLRGYWIEGEEEQEQEQAKAEAEEEENMSSGRSLSRGRRGRGSRSSSRPNVSLADTPTTSTKKTAPYDGTFGQNLIDHNVLPANFRHPDGTLPPKPDNLEDIRQALARRRPSLSPPGFSEADFDKFTELDSNAARERQVTSNVIPLINGDVGDSHTVGGEFPFHNLRPLTNGTLVSGNPDLYYGAHPNQLDSKVRQELDEYIVPSSQKQRPILPNFCLAVKGHSGTIEVAMRQACYDGALGARAMYQLRLYGIPEHEPEACYDNKAYALTSIYHAGVLRIYASHPIQTPAGKPGFAMTLVRGYFMTSDSDAFREGVAAFRNGRDWAKEQRDEAIRQANERAALATDAAGAVTGGDPASSNSTSADELALDDDGQRPPAAKRSRTHSRPRKQ